MISTTKLLLNDLDPDFITVRLNEDREFRSSAIFQMKLVGESGTFSPGDFTVTPAGPRYFYNRAGDDGQNVKRADAPSPNITFTRTGLLIVDPGKGKGGKRTTIEADYAIIPVSIKYLDQEPVIRWVVIQFT